MTPVRSKSTTPWTVCRKLDYGDVWTCPLCGKLEVEGPLDALCEGCESEPPVGARAKRFLAHLHGVVVDAVRRASTRPLELDGAVIHILEERMGMTPLLFQALGRDMPEGADELGTGAQAVLQAASWSREVLVFSLGEGGMCGGTDTLGRIELPDGRAAVWKGLDCDQDPHIVAVVEPGDSEVAWAEIVAQLMRDGGADIGIGFEYGNCPDRVELLAPDLIGRKAMSAAVAWGELEESGLGAYLRDAEVEPEDEDGDGSGSDPSDARRIAYAERWIIQGMDRDPWAPPEPKPKAKPKPKGAKQAKPTTRAKRATRRA